MLQSKSGAMNKNTFIAINNYETQLKINGINLF